MAQETLDKVGSNGREDLAKLYRDQVLTILDEGHILHGQIPTVRYDLGDLENQQLMDSIAAKGVLQAGLVWHFEDTKKTHVIFGTRRTLYAGQVSQERLGNDQDPIPMRYRVVVKKTCTDKDRAEALELFADENNRRKGNDWLTVCYAAHQQLTIGVDIGAVLARWPMVPSEVLLEKMTKDSGIIAACPRLQEHLAMIPAQASTVGALKKALAIAELPLDAQPAAMDAKPEKKDTRKYLAPKERTDLRDGVLKMLDLIDKSGMVLSSECDKEALRALASKL